MLSQLGAIIGNFDLFTIMLMVCGVFGGLIIGALPGLTSTMADVRAWLQAHQL